MPSGQRPLAILIILFVLNLELLPAKGEDKGDLPNLTNLCKPLGPIDCAATSLRCPTPKIDKVYGIAESTITPKNPAGVGIAGCGFGSANGSLDLPLKDFNGNPKQVAFKINFWQDNVISAFFSPKVVISEVMDQPTTIQVVKPGGAKSNKQPVKFLATRETKAIPQKDMKYVCSDEADIETCNGVFDPPFTFFNCFFGPGIVEGSVSTIHGAHKTCWDPFGGDSGTDVYWIALKNGWVTDSFVWTEFTPCGQVHPYPAFVAGVTGLIGSAVDWITCSDDLVSYDGTILITGPKGVPHK